MNRSGLQYGKRLFALALAAFLLVNITHAQPASAQEVDCAQTSPEPATHYSLYYENFKNNNYRDALPDLTWILENCPGFPSNKDNNFERAIVVYESFAEEAATPEEKREHLMKALELHDEAVTTLKEINGEIDEFMWIRDKGRFIQKHMDVLEDQKTTAIESYRKAYELDPTRLDPYYLDVILADYYSQGDIGGALDFLREVNESRGEEEGVKSIVTKYFAIIPPDEQIGFLEEQLKEDPENVEVIMQLFKIYRQEDYQTEMMELAPRLQQLDPTPDVLRTLMRLYSDNGNTAEAAKIFKQLETMPEVSLKAEDYLNMGIALQNEGSFSEANSYYRKALDMDPNLQRAQLAIADLWATLASTCGVTERQEQAVFWLIADQYSRAGNSAGAARYRQAFPTAEDIFYTDSWTEGQSTSYSWSCRGVTISGTTTVRKR